MWLCPSYKRPENLERLADAWQRTVPQSRLCVRLHEGDETIDELLRADWWPDVWTAEVGPLTKAPGACEWAFNKYPDEPFYGFIADDVVPGTHSWAWILSSSAGSEYISYPDDGIHGPNLCTHPCIGGDLVRAVGWWVLPGLDHNFMDTVWHALGQASHRLRYCEIVKFDHRHPIVGAAPMDQVYLRGAEKYDQDQERFQFFMNEGEFESTLDRMSAILGRNIAAIL